MSPRGPVTAIEGRPPSVGHLAFYTDPSGLATAVPPGGVIAIVVDPRRPQAISRVVLRRVVNVDSFEVECGCGNPRCTRVGKAVIRWTGSH